MENQKLLINDERTRLEAGETITIGSKQISLGDSTSFEETIVSVESDEDADIRIKISITGTRITTPPIPSGFRHSIGSISDGYVITDGTNEFVWVPVNQNQKIKLEVTANDNISSIKLYHPDGTSTSYTATGASYENDSINPTTNGFYVVTAYTEGGKTAVKGITIYSLYANTVTMITDEILSHYGVNSIEQAEKLFEEYGKNVDTAMESFVPLTPYYGSYQDVADYKSSVERNGGFYIGRYEAGALNYRTSGNKNATVSDIISTNGKPVCTANQIPYNNLTHGQAQGLAESMYREKEFTCTLLTGSAWDRTLGFIMEEGANKKTESQVYTNSKDWGNYEDASYTVTNTSAKYKDASANQFYPITSYSKEDSSQIIFTTGAMDRNSAKNIYDLAGNLEEYVLQKKLAEQDILVSRGGHFGCVGIPVNEHVINDGTTNIYSDFNGFRPALYL